jgi:hypothetical protein
MKNTATEIFQHDNKLDVAHKINNIELENWISHLKYMKSELKNLLVFYSTYENDSAISKEQLMQRFEIRRVDNKVLLSTLLDYKNKRVQLAECEDMQCDMVFIKEHESFRRMYLYHVDKYRKLKSQFFNDVEQKTII